MDAYPAFTLSQFTLCFPLPLTRASESWRQPISCLTLAEPRMSDVRWSDARRIEAWAGEMRVNLIRCVALIVFYGQHLATVHLLKDPTAGDESFGRRVTLIVLAWGLAAFLLHSCLSRRVLPPLLPFLTTTWDLAMITALLAAGENGPRSPLLILYVVVVAAAPLRLSLRLVWFTTLGAMLAAASMLGTYVYFQVGRDAYYDPTTNLRVARSAQVVFLLGLGTVGLIGGQLVRQAQRLVLGYPVVVVPEARAEPTP
jgi:hypothetical protein